jgi:hypothetical protein
MHHVRLVLLEADSNNFHTYRICEFVKTTKTIVMLHESLYPNRKYQSLAGNTEVKTRPLSRLCMKQNDT